MVRNSSSAVVSTARSSWQVATSKALESAVLLTFDGEGHGTYGGKSACADAAVQAYLLDGTLPAPGTRCT